MSASEHKKLVMKWYETLRDRDVEGWIALHHPDCMYNVAGQTIISGRMQFDQLLEDILPLVFDYLNPDNMHFCTDWKIVCQEGNRAVCMMRAEAEGVTGKRYNQLYCHMFDSRDGKLSEVWEFFDTSLANEVLWGDGVPEQDVPTINQQVRF